MENGVRWRNHSVQASRVRPGSESVVGSHAPGVRTVNSVTCMPLRGFRFMDSVPPRFAAGCRTGAQDPEPALDNQQYEPATTALRRAIREETRF